MCTIFEGQNPTGGGLRGFGRLRSWYEPKLKAGPYGNLWSLDIRVPVTKQKLLNVNLIIKVIKMISDSNYKKGKPTQIASIRPISHLALLR